jgi:hypothetical protein
MLSFWEQFALQFIIALLHSLKVDPSRVPYLSTVLRHIHDDIETILGLPPSVPPIPLPVQSTPAPPPSPVG